MCVTSCEWYGNCHCRLDPDQLHVTPTILAVGTPIPKAFNISNGSFLSYHQLIYNSSSLLQLINAPPHPIRRQSPLVFMPTSSLLPPPKRLLACYILRAPCTYPIVIDKYGLLFFSYSTAKYQLTPAFLLHYKYCREISTAMRLILMAKQHV